MEAYFKENYAPVNAFIRFVHMHLQRPFLLIHEHKYDLVSPYQAMATLCSGCTQRRQTYQPTAYYGHYYACRANGPPYCRNCWYDFFYGTYQSWFRKLWDEDQRRIRREEEYRRALGELVKSFDPKHKLRVLAVDFNDTNTYWHRFVLTLVHSFLY